MSVNNRRKPHQPLISRRTDAVALEVDMIFDESIAIRPRRLRYQASPTAAIGRKHPNQLGLLNVRTTC